MKFYLSAIVMTFIALCRGVTLFAQSTEDVPLNFSRLDLNDGRKLKNVVVKSYDAKSEKLLIIADGKAMTIPISSIPPPFDRQLKFAPPSGGFVSTISAPPLSPSIASASDQYTMEAPQPQQATKRSITRQQFMEQHPSDVPTRKPARKNPVSTQPAIEEQVPRDPLLAEASLTQHQAAAKRRAEQYFRYEHRMGSNSISVTSLSFELSVPTPVPGWAGRCSTTGKAFIEYYDSKGRSFQRTTSTFEVLTEQKTGEPLNVLDFSRKS